MAAYGENLMATHNAVQLRTGERAGAQILGEEGVAVEHRLRGARITSGNRLQWVLPAGARLLI